MSDFTFKLDIFKQDGLMVCGFWVGFDERFVGVQVYQTANIEFGVYIIMQGCFLCTKIWPYHSKKVTVSLYVDWENVYM